MRARDKLGTHGQKQQCSILSFSCSQRNNQSNFPPAALTSEKGIRDFFKVQYSYRNFTIKLQQITAGMVMNHEEL
jgi:hypothetical protein